MDDLYQWHHFPLKSFRFLQESPQRRTITTTFHHLLTLQNSEIA